MAGQGSTTAMVATSAHLAHACPPISLSLIHMLSQGPTYSQLQYLSDLATFHP